MKASILLSVLCVGGCAAFAAQPFVDQVVIVDDASADGTWEAASRIEGAVTYRMPRNTGYGGNQKQCYKLALELGAGGGVMVHPR